MQILDTAWTEKHPHIIVLVAHDGMGKTALISRWVQKNLDQPLEGMERVIGWSFIPAVDQEVSARDDVNQPTTHSNGFQLKQDPAP